MCNDVDNYVESLSFDEVIKEIKEFGGDVEFPICDDDYPDWEDDIRVDLMDMYGRDFQ